MSAGKSWVITPVKSIYFQAIHRGPIINSPHFASFPPSLKLNHHSCGGVSEAQTCAMLLAKGGGQQHHLVGGFNPSEKYARQIGNLPQIGLKTKKYLKPPPSHGNPARSPKLKSYQLLVGPTSGSAVESTLVTCDSVSYLVS